MPNAIVATPVTGSIIALKSGGADALVGALVVVGLLALSRRLIRLAGDPAPDEGDDPPVSSR